MYDHFAEIYDEFMQTVSYEEWADYIEKLWEKHGSKKPKLVLDLACGTGSLTCQLARRGYEMIAIDQSAQMLEIAEDKLRKTVGEGTPCLQQDMREFELYGTVDAILCTCDSLNYLLEEQDLARVFRLAENYLEPDGLLIFDLNTAYKYAEILGDQTFADTSEEAAFIWQNYYYEEEAVNEYQVTFFEQVEDGLYERHEEIHYQKAYDKDKVIELLKRAGLRPVAVYECFTTAAPGPETERLCFVAKEHLYHKLRWKRDLSEETVEWETM